MKILINASIIEKGGAKQVAESVLHEFKLYNDFKFIVVVSEELNKAIKQESFDSNFTFYVVSKKVNMFYNILNIRRDLKKIESVHLPDIVFTIFGPIIWRPKSKHITGFADGWCYNPKSLALKKLNKFQKINRILLSFLKNSILKISTDFIIVETNDAKNKIIKYLNFKSSKIFVVGNTYSHYFNNQLNSITSSNTFNLITICAPYPHKNLSVINEVIPYLVKKNLDFCFYLTIENDTFKDLFKENKHVKNLGVVKTENCPNVYAKSDALFFPTLLETFSASYPEAMKMKKPILTSDLDFARDICADAAVYFDPINAKDIANKIENLIVNKELYNSLINKGIKRLDYFETSNSRAVKYINIFNKIVKINKKNEK